MKKLFISFILISINIYAQNTTNNVEEKKYSSIRLDTNAYKTVFGTQRQPVWVYIGEAKRALHQGDTSYALYLMNQTLSYYPDSADAHYYLGMIYEREAGDPADAGGAASYRLAIEEYKKSIELYTNFSIPAYKLDSYFNLLNIYEKLIDEENYAIIEKEISDLADRTFDKAERGRIYFKLAEHYDERNRSTASIDFYRKAYLNGYRQKLSLFRISIIYRKMRNYVSEKEYLILANKYEFKNLEPSNFEVEKSIVQRLKALQNVRIPKKLT